MKKIHIVFNQEQVTKDHIHYSQLDMVSDASCDHISVGVCLDYLPVQYRIQVLQKILSKLRYEGIIEVEGTDIIEVSRLIYYGGLVSEDMCSTLYNGKQSIDSINNFVNLLEQLGLYIITKQIDGLSYYIKAKRNG